MTAGEIYWLWKIANKIYFETIIIKKNIVLLLSMTMKKILLLLLDTNIVLGVINYQ